MKQAVQHEHFHHDLVFGVVEDIGVIGYIGDLGDIGEEDRILGDGHDVRLLLFGQVVHQIASQTGSHTVSFILVPRLVLVLMVEE